MLTAESSDAMTSNLFLVALLKLQSRNFFKWNYLLKIKTVTGLDCIWINKVIKQGSETFGCLVL